MGKLKYLKKDLFATRRKVIAHGVNCMGVFGAGVAAGIACEYPMAKKAYLEKFKKRGWMQGEVQFVHIKKTDDTDQMIIANMATQRYYGRPRPGPEGVYTIYEAVEKCMKTLFYYCQELGQGVAMPKIGAGLGGGDWEKIEGIIKRLLGKYSVEVDVHYL